jgi:hypothetical protein
MEVTSLTPDQINQVLDGIEEREVIGLRRGSSPEERMALLVMQVGDKWNTAGRNRTSETLMDAAKKALPEAYPSLSITDAYESGFRSDYGKVDNTEKQLWEDLSVAIYNETQEQLADAGIERVRVWRGMLVGESNTDFPDSSTPLSVGEVAGDVLSSWSTRYSTAKNFAQGAFPGSGPGSGRKSVVLHAIIPSEYVFSIGNNEGGVGTRSESELVVLGAPFEADIMTRLYSERDVLKVLRGDRSPFREGEEVEKAKKAILIDEDDRNRYWLRSS